MKRSEMLADLRNLIHCQQKAGLEPPEVVAERILNLVERRGMLPPGVKSDIWNRFDQDHYIFNEWEPES